jgi:hypothetical protein
MKSEHRVTADRSLHWNERSSDGHARARLIERSPPAESPLVKPIRELERDSRRTRSRTEGERCDLCAAPFFEPHSHLLDLKDRSVLCTCSACAVVFPAAGKRRYRRVPAHVARRALGGQEAMEATAWPGRYRGS